MNKDLVNIIDSPVDIKRLVRKLKFDLEDIEHAVGEQPTLRLESGRFRAQVGLKAASMKRRLNRIVGKKSLKIRRREDRTTEAAIKNALSLDDEVQTGQREYDTMEVFEEFAKDLVEAYRERSMALSVLTRLRASEISSHLASAKGEEEVDSMRKRARHMSKRFEDIG